MHKLQIMHTQNNNDTIMQVINNKIIIFVLYVFIYILWLTHLYALKTEKIKYIDWSIEIKEVYSFSSDFVYSKY